MSKLLDLLKEAQRVASSEFGVPDIFQPGVARKFAMAEALGHKLVPVKHGVDARDGREVDYGYLTGVAHHQKGKSDQRCSFAIGGLTADNLSRITRNGRKFFFFGIFCGGLELEEVWQVAVPAVLAEAQRQLASSRQGKVVSVNFTQNWLIANGTLVFADNSPTVPLSVPLSIPKVPPRAE